MGRIVDSRRVVDEVLSRTEESYPALDVLQGTLLLAEGHPEKALGMFQQVEEASPKNPTLYRRMGNAYLKMKQPQNAKKAYQNALNIDPEDARAYHGLAVSHLQQGHFGQTVDAALTSIGIQYHQPAVHYHLGEALFRMGKFAQAADAFRIAVHQAPGMRRAHLRLVEIYRDHLKRPRLARQHAQFAREQIQ
jgi:tetratricopeptide (TPR) repeat protein